MATRPSEELVIDRTLTDVNLERDKGHYNIEDLNRVREWSIYIRDLLNENGYYVSITPDEEWEMETMPYQSKVDKVKSDVMTLKNAYYALQEYDLHIGQNTMSYVTANDIEKILNDIEFLLNSMQQYFVHSGVAVSGQTRLWQNRFRRY